ncbi:hypothetical protein C5E02_13435 [Rathayibacter rathayi]|uniref:Uncharacterized protein n=1 Tax=Rathayibacter rathayi TaxID=33887 RepID=A0ABD6W966_RATRA|nr:hypothetical protein C5C04_06275 [Rathayibacter rathayi]PPG76106.1 hypothetical protein C5C15_11565 [Rathayibacter rathayi]PPG76852.1 hypothetical protein C5C23_06655 [Rathayibacter rathayi]PPG88937.1 hypothetical protein C5C22_15600 [Rathayibacter rathayi]PPG93551.1 hypothetical protein C5C00_13645 [Rathayibacter rathayi]
MRYPLVSTALTSTYTTSSSAVEPVPLETEELLRSMFCALDCLLQLMVFVAPLPSRLAVRGVNPAGNVTVPEPIPR